MSRISKAATPRTSKMKNSIYEITNIPFPEWIDHDVTTEKWDFKIKADPKKTLSSRKSISSKISVNQGDDLFVDVQYTKLPPSLKADSWKRLSEIYENVEFVMTKFGIDFTSLREGSTHIMHSEFVRSFLNSISILEYTSAIQPWQIESTGVNYIPNTENVNWKPWHHIYAFCGAGKGQNHNPKYNPAGKYIVRLHWLGCWRKIYVDDRMPVDQNNKILLPGFKFAKEEPVDESEKNKDGVAIKKSTTTILSEKSNKSEKAKSSKKSKSSAKSEKSSKKGGKGKKLEEKKVIPQIEVWPYILSKALLKIAALTWTNEEEIVDFNPIACLTGWTCHKISANEMCSDDIWNICVAYSPNFKWEEDMAKSKDSKAKSAGKKSEGKKSGSKKGSKKDSSSKGSKKGKKNKQLDKTPIQEIIDETKVYCLVGSCKSVKNFIKDLDIEVTCNNQEFLIEQSRDKPLVKPEPRPVLARWKRFRWLKWAISKGLWPANDTSVPVKCLKFYNNFKKTDTLPPITASEPKEKKGKKGKKEKDSKGSKGSKSSSKNGKGGALKIFPLVDKSVWVDFMDVQSYIEYLYIFFRPSQFDGFVQLSNVSSLEKPTSAKDKSKKVEEKVHQVLKWPLTIKESRNEPVYLLIDSLSPKLLIINLSQIGYVDRIMIPMIDIDEEPYANFVLEDYDWQVNSMGRIQVYLSTTGSKAILLYLRPGRVVCKLWIWCNNNYILNLLCNVNITIGTLDVVLDGMNCESILLGKLAQEVGAAFGALVQAFGTPAYPEEMRKFNNSYKPNIQMNKKKSRDLYEEFLNILIKNLDNSEAAFALKVLFMEPNITQIGFKGLVPVEKPYEIYETELLHLDCSEENVEEIKARQLAAVKIQSNFKTLFIRKLMERHKQGNKGYYQIYELLKKIYYDIFSDSKRNVCMKLLKQLYLNREYLKNTALYKELRKVIDIKSYKGQATTTEDQWIFITRQKFINKSTDPLIMRAALFANLPEYVLRIFDNDTLQEVRRYTNTTESYFYPPNQRGFTVLCYGWAREIIKVNWKLYLIFLRNVNNPFITSDENLDTKILNYIYTPNVYNSICKCKLEIRQNADVTIRLATTGAKAELELLIRNAYGEILNKIHGKKNVILPLTQLRCPETAQECDFGITEQPRKTVTKLSTKSISKQRLPPFKANINVTPTIFYIEASVLNHSWPLTRKEWLTVKMERSKYLLQPPAGFGLPSKIGSKTKKTSAPIELATSMEDPSWTLQLIHNAGENLILERDFQRQNEINDIKTLWYQDQPDRYEKSEQIRQNYLEELCSQSRESLPITTIRSTVSDSDAVLEKWIPETMMVKPFDLTEYYCTKEEEPIYPDLSRWASMLQNRSKQDIETLNYTVTQCEERMDRVDTDQIENFIIIRQWYDECRMDSAEMIKATYALRDKFIEMIIEENKKKEESPEKKDKKKDKKGKKDQKGKKK